MRSPWTRTAAAWVLVLAACGGGGAVTPPSPELETLSRSLEGVHGVATDEDRERLGAALTAVLPDLASWCAGCTRRVRFDDVAGTAVFTLDLRDATGDLALVHMVYRPELDAGELGGWASERLGDHPADFGDGAQLVVWAGRFEIRVFPMRPDQAGEPRLREIAGAVPIDDLARL